MILTMRRMTDSRTGSTTIMFAAFVAVLTIGVMVLSKSASHSMMVAINKSTAIRY